ncbi:hypothetical protein FQR65_LT19301 [Abscondita terminalis]|nr:hypothetical protein FQR65_LT19301 [Abscondita terminalis]
MVGILAALSERPRPSAVTGCRCPGGFVRAVPKVTFLFAVGQRFPARAFLLAEHGCPSECFFRSTAKGQYDMGSLRMMVLLWSCYRNGHSCPQSFGVQCAFEREIGQPVWPGCRRFFTAAQETAGERPAAGTSDRNTKRVKPIQEQKTGSVNFNRRFRTTAFRFYPPSLRPSGMCGFEAAARYGFNVSAGHRSIAGKFRSLPCTGKILLLLDIEIAVEPQNESFLLSVTSQVMFRAGRFYGRRSRCVAVTHGFGCRRSWWGNYFLP